MATPALSMKTMEYTRHFRRLRESKQLTLEELAARAGCHRSTVINVESGRPVKFRTIAGLMETMGFAPDSEEMRAIALLWLEHVSGLSFTGAALASARKRIEAQRKRGRRELDELEEAVVRGGLSPADIRLLLFAARHPEAIEVLGHIRRLAESLAPAPEELADPEEHLRVAEDKPSVHRP